MVHFAVANRPLRRLSAEAESHAAAEGYGCSRFVRRRMFGPSLADPVTILTDRAYKPIYIYLDLSRSWLTAGWIRSLNERGNAPQEEE